MSDQDIIDAAIERNASDIISDGQARVIASAWHGGQSSALYSLASTGAIDLRHLTIEIDHDWISNEPHPKELLALTRYVVEHGDRGPVEGWSSLWG